MPVLAAESLAEKIADYLADQIIRGELKSGERIQETRVVEELEVSRGPVREALLLLESRHLVTILPRRGAIVSELNEKRIHNIYDMYTTLLAMLSTLVAKNWTDEHKEGLLAQVAMLQDIAAKKQATDFMLAAFGLMRAVYPIADNEYLSQILEDLKPAVHRLYAMTLRHTPGEAEAAKTFLAALVMAILERDIKSIPDICESYGQRQRVLILESLPKEN